jgi:hypothetical protein
MAARLAKQPDVDGETCGGNGGCGATACSLLPESRSGNRNTGARLWERERLLSPMSMVGKIDPAKIIDDETRQLRLGKHTAGEWASGEQLYYVHF